MKQAFRINRGLGAGQYRLADIFPDIGTYAVLSSIFADADERDRVIVRTRVFLVDTLKEIFVSNDDGSITIGLAHLRNTSDEFLYLDIIHELCHVKQHFEGRNLYDRSKAYVDRETEIEAYELTLREARRMQMNEETISNYLLVSWITPEEHRRLAARLKVAGFPPEGD
ncbi:MAG: ImmA/IrrE family metallo-endopeptidase [Thermodesulfobacteriota bacterium]